MIEIPELQIEGIRCVSGHLLGVNIIADAFVVSFSIRAGFEGDDLLVLKQEVQDEDDYTLDRAVTIGRQILAENLEQLAKDIRTGIVVPDDEQEE